jgi:hypothetical protein
MADPWLFNLGPKVIPTEGRDEMAALAFRRSPKAYLRLVWEDRKELQPARKPQQVMAEDLPHQARLRPSRPFQHHHRAPEAQPRNMTMPKNRDEALATLKADLMKNTAEEERPTIEALFVLAGGAMDNIARCANAMERIADALEAQAKALGANG